LAEIERPDHDQVHEIIEEYAVKSDHQPEVYTLHGEERELIDNCFKHDTAEEIVKALRDNGSKFALNTLDTILKRSPSSVKITLEHLRRGTSLSFKECLRMEHELWQTVPVSFFLLSRITKTHAYLLQYSLLMIL
jgi:3-hydroxyisobutyryl-CoA hydrolase